MSTILIYHNVTIHHHMPTCISQINTIQCIRYTQFQRFGEIKTKNKITGNKIKFVHFIRTKEMFSNYRGITTKEKTLTKEQTLTFN